MLVANSEFASLAYRDFGEITGQFAIRHHTGRLQHNQGSAVGKCGKAEDRHLWRNVDHVCHRKLLVDCRHAGWDGHLLGARKVS